MSQSPQSSPQPGPAQPTPGAEPRIMKEMESDFKQVSTMAHDFSWKLPAMLVTAVVALALLGFALTGWNPQNASWYWVIIVPVIGVVCLWHSWVTADKNRPIWPQIRRQVLHWLGLIIAMKILLVMHLNEDITGQAMGLSALLLLAVGCFLAGVHFDWIFLPIGFVLGLCVVGASFVEEYVWVALISLGLALGLLFLFYRMGGRSSAFVSHAPPKKV